MKHSAVAIGTFDGFHLGHRYLVRKLLEIAAQKKLKCVIVALSKPVKPVPGILTTESEKVDLMRQYPVDEILRFRRLPVRQIAEFPTEHESAFVSDVDDKVGVLARIVVIVIVQPGVIGVKIRGPRSDAGG